MLGGSDHPYPSYSGGEIDTIEERFHVKQK